MTLRESLGQNYILRNLSNSLGLMLEDRATMVYFSFLVLVILLGVFGPVIAPYPYDEPVQSADGSILIKEPPSVDHPLGTNRLGQDVLSRVLYGARPTAITGLLGGSIIIGIGLFVGVTAGYFGGRVDNVLMRITDIAYGVPLIPFAIVMVTLLGVGFIESILVIAVLLWRGSARVIRSQVLQIKQRPFILDCKASGASTFRIVFKHILPNVATMAVLFFSLGVGYSIVLQAGLAFVGVSDPFVPSWGIMIRNAYTSGSIGDAWWWSIPPGLLIALTVMCTFMFGRSYERLAGQTEDDAFVEMG
jgi:peptide/nickel transport system permease protein